MDSRGSCYWWNGALNKLYVCMYGRTFAESTFGVLAVSGGGGGAGGGREGGGGGGATGGPVKQKQQIQRLVGPECAEGH